MDLTFELGDPQQPKGHAIIYFRVNTEPDKVYATYAITLPVKADLGKYVPPFLASHLGNMPLADFSAFAMPPLPEAVEGYDRLERLCRMPRRRPDLRRQHVLLRPPPHDGGRHRGRPVLLRALRATVPGAGVRGHHPRAGTGDAAGASPRSRRPWREDRAYAVNEVLFSLMSEKDKLAELARLLGRLRFAVEGYDNPTVNEVSEEITVLARHLPENFRVANLLAVAKDSSQRGSTLAQLYLDRCFRLSEGDISTVQTLDDQTAPLRRGHSGGRICTDQKAEHLAQESGI